MEVPQRTRQYFLPKGRQEGYKNLKIRDVDLPKLKANDVLFKINAVSLQYRDYAFANELYGGLYNLEIVPCSDMAGEVIAVGEDVTEWKVGDRVCANFSPAHLYGPPTEATLASSFGGTVPGVLAEHRSFPAECLVRIPSHFSYIQASTLPWALQFAIAAGATGIATSSSDEKLAIAKGLGAKHLINYRKDLDWGKEVMKCTNGRGVDHIVEIGGQGTISKSINSVRMGGCIYLIGVLDQAEFPKDIFHLILARSAVVQGTLIGSIPHGPATITTVAKSDIQGHDQAHRRGLRENVTSHRQALPFEDAVAAFVHLESQKHVGKIVIQVSTK
ncbi:zinc-binding alcohol dehydrogenase [Ephemerocybe angulata]|uniref:Zinc-binding alcohol dehydrogenase n=1 Tax=Ephemerocybe angulata TaxID=980116 RepID=A0A8H6M2Z2_9AGAR|nr:zinc-binding alcohol dehydrogenase [Tulosesus angulatus]